MEASKAPNVGQWPYNSVNGSPEAIVSVRIRIIGHNQWSTAIEFLVDTGFSGDVLITRVLFNTLNYNTLTPRFDYIYTATNQPVRVEIYQTLIQIGHIQKDVELVIPISSQVEVDNSVGMIFLQSFLAQFNGQQNTLTLQ